MNQAVTLTTKEFGCIADNSSKVKNRSKPQPVKRLQLHNRKRKTTKKTIKANR